MAHPYDAIVGHLLAAIAELKKVGLDESLAKGRVGEVLLAHHLGHMLVPGDKGADGVASDGKRYEYKVSTVGSDQYNFNLGGAPTVRTSGDAAKMVDSHFDGYEGAYCALVEGGKVIKVVYCTAAALVPYLKGHVQKIEGYKIQKNFSSIEAFAAIAGAEWKLKP